jgi:hypothetical protein
MKKHIIIIALVLSNYTFSQTKVNVDSFFKTGGLQEFTIIAKDDQVEFGGHIFDNNKSKDPIKFKASLEGMKIYDSKNEYQYRKCENQGCIIVHLELKKSGSIPFFNQGWSSSITPNILITN